MGAVTPEDDLQRSRAYHLPGAPPFLKAGAEMVRRIQGRPDVIVVNAPVQHARQGVVREIEPHAFAQNR